MNPYENAAGIIRSAAIGAAAGVHDAETAAMVEAVRVLLHGIEGPAELRDGLIATPARVVTAWREMTRGYGIDPEDILTAAFDGEGYDEIVLESFPFMSTCEHHMLPFGGTAHVGYLPNGKVTGLSKLVRLVTDCYAPRLQMQERITIQTADALMEHLDARGAIVVLDASHSCVRCRGVRVAGARTKTSAVRGVFKDNPAARAEAFALIASGGHP